MAHFSLKLMGLVAIAANCCWATPPATAIPPIIVQAPTPVAQVKRPRLNLTPAQRKQLARITEDQRKQIYAMLTPQQLERMTSSRKRLRMSQLLSSGNLSEEQKTKIQAIMESTSQKVNALLNPEQVKLIQGDR